MEFRESANAISKKRFQRSPQSWKKATFATDGGVGCQHPGRIWLAMWCKPKNPRRLQRTDLIVPPIEAFIHAAVNAERRPNRRVFSDADH